MAWANPTTWTAGQTVTAANLNQELRDNLKHIAGVAGFTATPVTTGHGIEPLSGYFAGANKANYHIEAGSLSATTNSTGQATAFVNAYAAAPVVVCTPYTDETTAYQEGVILTEIAAASFSVRSYYPRVVYWMAFGSDT